MNSIGACLYYIGKSLAGQQKNEFYNVYVGVNFEIKIGI